VLFKTPRVYFTYTSVLGPETWRGWAVTAWLLVSEELGSGIRNITEKLENINSNTINILYALLLFSQPIFRLTPVS